MLTSRSRVYARNCTVTEVSKEETKSFLNKNHLQGYAKSKINLGLYFNDKLVSIMTFDKPRYNKNYQYELIRYCSVMDVIGGAEKLFWYFVSTYKPGSVVSYCDMSKFDGNVYDNLGFSLLKEDVKPSKHWYNMKTRKHVTDNLLRQRGFDQLFGEEFGRFGKGSSNDELMYENGFVEVYDCGQKTFVFENKQAD